MRLLRCPGKPPAGGRRWWPLVLGTLAALAARDGLAAVPLTVTFTGQR